MHKIGQSGDHLMDKWLRTHRRIRPPGEVHPPCQRGQVLTGGLSRVSVNTRRISTETSRAS
jgi:hypothetical protein